MYVNIDNDTALAMLMERVEFWTDDAVTKDLYEQMYEQMIADNVFDDFDVMQIVDNDYINWCTVYEEGDDEYEQIKELWNDNERALDWGYIEAESDGAFLIRSY